MQSKRLRQVRINGRMLGMTVLLLPLMLTGISTTISSASPAMGAPLQQNESATVLAAGDPPLTQAMVDHCIAVWEVFFEIKINQEQHNTLQQAMVQAWKRGDKQEVSGVQWWLKLYGKESEILAARAANQSAFVEAARQRTNDPESRVVVEIYDAAHPERKDFMRNHGMGDLVGEWKSGGAMLATRVPYSSQVIGSTFTDSISIIIFPDGRFKHFWVHSHCDRGNTCCRTYGTDVNGAVFVEGGKLVLKAESGNQFNNDPCVAANNSFAPIQPHEERVGWSIKRRANNLPALCLDAQPFNPWHQGPGQAVCYERK